MNCFKSSFYANYKKQFIDFYDNSSTTNDRPTRANVQQILKCSSNHTTKEGKTAERKNAFRLHTQCWCQIPMVKWKWDFSLYLMTSCVMLWAILDVKIHKTFSDFAPRVVTRNYIKKPFVTFEAFIGRCRARRFHAHAQSRPLHLMFTLFVLQKHVLLFVYNFSTDTQMNVFFTESFRRA